MSLTRHMGALLAPAFPVSPTVRSASVMARQKAAYGTGITAAKGTLPSRSVGDRLVVGFANSTNQNGVNAGTAVVAGWTLRKFTTTFLGLPAYVAIYERTATNDASDEITPPQSNGDATSIFMVVLPSSPPTATWADSVGLTQVKNTSAPITTTATLPSVTAVAAGYELLMVWANYGAAGFGFPYPTLSVPGTYSTLPNSSDTYDATLSPESAPSGSNYSQARAYLRTVAAAGALGTTAVQATESGSETSTTLSVAAARVLFSP